MKKIFAVIVMLSVALTFAQEKSKVDLNKDGDLTVATYYHDNGAVAQQGAFNKEGELHGVWTSYTAEGNKVTVGNYVNGNKAGKWLFWSNNKLKEVDYIDSRIASVSEWTDKVQLAISN
ncbi:nicotinic acid mononucleotide adenyltransferase [Psychroserpens burtonensis]|uniref:Nicotinic acid mononucleotide adenyltransferase n=1 Tax=Psychroserpens burtonensis TaxID=49278 RepID=A0A5C7B5V4_9FLAO|nr:nicotinic acid mononucleotide adenyltransferase [Psychroserpens burtonensis]TXE16289.1 nicotinic acid mononucleotide adenyltransferase [Psychroserpens burtonensis]